MKPRRWWPNLLRLVLSAVTLALLIRAVGGREVAQALREADLRLLGLASLLFLLGIGVRALRWRALLRGLGLRPPLLRLFELYLVGSFFNAFLLSGFGGDVVRVVELAQEEQQAAAVGTVFVDRMTGLLSSMVLGLCVLPFAAGLAPWLVAAFVAVAVGGLLGGALLLEGQWLSRLTARLPRALSLAGEGKLAQIYAAVTGSGPRAIAEALLLSTVFNGINVTVHWLCGRAVGIEAAGFGFYFVAVPLLSLTLLLPISVGGLGARDGVAQLLFSTLAVPQARIAGMSLSVYLVSVAVGLLGGALYAGRALAGLLRRRPPA